MNDYERLSNFEHKNERILLVDKKLVFRSFYNGFPSIFWKLDL